MGKEEALPVCRAAQVLRKMMRSAASPDVMPNLGLAVCCDPVVAGASCDLQIKCYRLGMDCEEDALVGPE